MIVGGKAEAKLVRYLNGFQVAKSHRGCLRDLAERILGKVITLVQRGEFVLIEVRPITQQVGTTLAKRTKTGGLVRVIHKRLIAKNPAQQVGIVGGQQRKPRIDGHGAFAGEVFDLAGKGLCRLFRGRGGSGLGGSGDLGRRL